MGRAAAGRAAAVSGRGGASSSSSSRSSDQANWSTAKGSSEQAPIHPTNGVEEVVGVGAAHGGDNDHVLHAWREAWWTGQQGLAGRRSQGGDAKQSA